MKLLWAQLLLVSCVWTISLHAQQSGPALVFYGQPQVSEDLWPALFQILRADLNGVADFPNGAVLDKDAVFIRSDHLLGVSFSHIITVKLLGRCDVLPQTNRLSQSGPLGWVWLVSGKIQPFVSIDCARLAQVLRPAVAGFNKQERRNAMLEAIAHVLIHEWSHIASQNPGHTAHGVTRADLSANELIGAPRSRFFH